MTFKALIISLLIISVHNSAFILKQEEEDSAPALDFDSDDSYSSSSSSNTCSSPRPPLTLTRSDRSISIEQPIMNHRENLKLDRPLRVIHNKKASLSPRRRQQLAELLKQPPIRQKEKPNKGEIGDGESCCKIF